MQKLLKILLFTLLFSPLSNAQGADATPFGPPSAVTTVTPTLVSNDGTDINVAWSGGNPNGTTILGYQAIPYSGTDFANQASVSCSGPGGSDSCTVTGLAWSTIYKFKVITLSSGGSVTSIMSTNSATTPTQAQTVAITGTPSSVAFGDPDFQLFANASSGLPITGWTIPSTTSICSVDASGTVHFLAVGVCTVRATQNGSGSAYGSAFAEASITSAASLTASVGSATSVQSVQATLNATVPYPGAETTPSFCISTTNTTSDTCSLPSGVSIGSYTPTKITDTSGTSVSAVVSGLTQNTTYYFWIRVTATGATAYKTGTSSFTTTSGPSLAYSGITTLTTGTAVTGTLTATSGSGVYASWSGSSLPTGLTFNPGTTANTSSISGTPSAAGNFTALYSVTDSSGLETQLNVSYVVSAPPTTPTSPTSPTTPTTPTSPTVPTAPSAPGVDEAKPVKPVEPTKPVPEVLPTSVLAKKISSPVKTFFSVRDIPSYAKISAPTGKLRGVQDIKISGRVVYVTPIKTFSGIILIPLQIKGKRTTVERYLSLTVMTTNLSGALFNSIPNNSTKVSWKLSSNASSYAVYKNDMKVCESKSNTCTFAGLSGPNSLVKVKAYGADGVEGKLTAAYYNSKAPAVIASLINFDNGSSSLNEGAITTLKSFMLLIKREGFSSIRVVGYTDSTGKGTANLKLSFNRASSVTNFLMGKEVGYVDSIGRGNKNPVKSNSTTEGRAANRRVEILVN